MDNKNFLKLFLQLGVYVSFDGMFTMYIHCKHWYKKHTLHPCQTFT